MSLVATFDWAGFGMALGTMFIGFMTVWNAYKAKKTAKVVDTIHTLTNSKMGMELFTGMVSAKALAKLDPSEENITLFKIAEKKYREHQNRQAMADDAATHEKDAQSSGFDY